MESLFSVSVVSSHKRSGSSTPEFTTTTSEGGIKINEAASKLMDIQSGDTMVIVSNYDKIQKAIADKNEQLLAWSEETGNDVADYPVFWGIAKGYPDMTSDGEPILTPERLSKSKTARYIEEGKIDEDGEAIPDMIPRFKGSKMSTANGAAGYGVLSGSDKTNWELLNGTFDNLIIRTVSTETVEIANEYGDTIIAYPIVDARDKEKLER